MHEIPVTAAELPSRIDHLVYACADLQRGIAEIEQMLGVRAAFGGRHPMWGTHNALIALGPRTYLELIAPDVERAPAAEARPFGLDRVARSHLIAWAANSAALDAQRGEAARRGVHLGEVQSGRRRRPDNVMLGWRLTDLRCVMGDGLVPFLIDWGTSPHPASAAPQGATLVGLRAEHPEPERIRKMMSVLELDLQVDRGQRQALIATIRCPKGNVDLT